MAIALALVGTVTFFTAFMEHSVGLGELTRAELLRLGANVRMAHSAASIINDNKRN